ncbi:uncharacterized protein OCT59_013165 [Rhizophagus irregularis]|uniref:uncharacterized protein n=1 Tax=Rhizophagus irregularis TaxID=588596 RepID=UPI000CABA678|nr:hypothetical protein OCT59_013165 [Rhizophagus irregularis]GBC27797.1 hypothetical protein RIR_jg3413.t1 [Rhizophagus irregularis DAOM 181602=DAOM 197198]
MTHLKDIKPTVDPYAPLLKHLQRLNEGMKKLSDIHLTLLIRNQLLVEIADDNKIMEKKKEKRKLTE